MTADEIKDRTKKYLASFIKDNDLLDALLLAMSQTRETLSDEIGNLGDSYWTGKGIQLTAEENRIFGNNLRSSVMCEDSSSMLSEAGEVITSRDPDGDPEYQDRLGRRYEILVNRGRESGIVEDIRAILGESSVEIKFHDFKESGIIPGVSWFGKDTTFMTKNIIEIFNLPKSLQVPKRPAYIEDTINRFIKPINSEIIFTGN